MLAGRTRTRSSVFLRVLLGIPRRCLVIDTASCKSIFRSWKLSKVQERVLNSFHKIIKKTGASLIRHQRISIISITSMPIERQSFCYVLDAGLTNVTSDIVYGRAAKACGSGKDQTHSGSTKSQADMARAPKTHISVAPKAAGRTHARDPGR